MLAAALLPAGAVAARTQSAQTRIASAHVYRVGDRVLVDAIVWQPDAHAAARRGARRDGGAPDVPLHPHGSGGAPGHRG